LYAYRGQRFGKLPVSSSCYRKIPFNTNIAETYHESPTFPFRKSHAVQLASADTVVLQKKSHDFGFVLRVAEYHDKMHTLHSLTVEKLKYRDGMATLHA
jgi:hypothetical protein